jgi:RimJ/RimL family protein N-acetyltransferase
MRPLIQPDLAFLKALDELPETNYFLGFRNGRSVLNQKAIDLALDPDSKTKEEFFAGWIIFLKESRAPIGFISLGMRHSDQLPLTLKDRVHAMLLPLIEKEQKDKGEELTAEKQRKLLYKRVFYLGLSYIIHPEHRGKGYGREAVRAATKFGKELGATLVLASVYADNQNSKNLLKAAGYTRVNNGIKLEELYVSDPLPEL